MHAFVIDEAGTSGAPHEPFSIEAGVIIPNEERAAVRHAMNSVVSETVPPQFRDGFVFHAKDLTDSKPASISVTGSTQKAALKQIKKFR